MILVIAEQRDGKLNRVTWETLVGAQQLAQTSEMPIAVLVPGTGARGPAGELAAAQVQEVVTLEHAALEPYTPDGFTAALQEAIAQLRRRTSCCRTPTRPATSRRSSPHAWTAP